MNSISQSLNDERIIATYPSSDALVRAKVVLKRKLGLPESSLTIIKPRDTEIGSKLEGNSRKIGRSLLKLHIWYSTIGLVVGMSVAFLLVNFGPALTQTNPLLTYIAFISPGLIIGAFYAGFRSLKPEHDVGNLNAVTASQSSFWTLVVKTEQANVSKNDIIEEIQQTGCQKLN